MKLDINERIEDLQCNGLQIIQNKDLYTFTSDSVILANFLKIKNNETAVEIGTGCGIISILTTAKTNVKKITAFELQTQLADLAQKNVDLNNLNDKIEIINDDVKNFAQYLAKGECDVVFSNPPYMDSKEFDKVESSRAKGRHDKYLTAKEFCKVASGILNFGGRLYLVYGAERACEIIHELISQNIEPKRMFFTDNGKGRKVLIVIEAVKGGKHSVQILPELVTNDRDGKYLEELKTKYVTKK